MTFEQVFGATPAACYIEAASYYDPTAVQSGIAGGTIVFDATAAVACVAGLAAVPAPTCSTFWQQGPAFPAACSTVFTGTVATGGACSSDFECAGQAYCGDAGTCTAFSSARTVEPATVWRAALAVTAMAR